MPRYGPTLFVAEQRSDLLIWALDHCLRGVSVSDAVAGSSPVDEEENAICWSYMGCASRLPSAPGLARLA